MINVGNIYFNTAYFSKFEGTVSTFGKQIVNPSTRFSLSSGM